jgi:rubrerythrin
MNQENLIERSQKLVYEDLNFDYFKENPLSEDVLRALRYFLDIENHTSCYLRDILATPSHRDPEITAFLSVWGYEEYFHSVAIGEILRVHGQDPFTRIKNLRQNLSMFESLRPALFCLTSKIVNFFPALHMSWGAINEVSTQVGYERLSKKANNAILTELFARIMRQEGRHLAFYKAKATELLENSPKLQIKVRKTLKRFWKPVGLSVEGKKEAMFLAQFLFSDEQGINAAKRVDNLIALIPGLENINLFQNSLRRLLTLKAA